MDLTTATSTTASIAEAIAQGWTRIGVKTAVDTMPAATYFSRAVRAEFSVRVTGWASDTGEDSSNLIQIVASSDPAKGRGATFDPSHYANPAIDAMIEKAVATIDPEERETLYQQATQAVMPDMPFIPLHHQVNIWGLRKGLSMRLRMQEGIRAWDIAPQ